MIRSFFILFTFLLGSPLYAYDYAIQSKDIEKIKMFPSGAEVHRKIPVTWNQGFQELTIKGLSAYIQGQSLRFELPDGVQLLDYYLVQDYLHEANENPETTKFRKELETKRKALSALQSEKKMIQEKENLIRQNYRLSTGNFKGNAAELKSYMDYLLGVLQQNEVELRKVEDKIQTHQKELERWENQARTSGLSNKIAYSYSVVIKVHSQRNGPSPILLDYMVGNCSWSLEYDVLAQTAPEERLLWVKKAKIKQKTGENWTQVKLEVSNLSPTTHRFLPQLSPWELDFYTPSPQARSKVSSMAKRESDSWGMEEMVFDAAEMDYEDIDFSAERVEEGLAIHYRLSQKVDLPPGDQASTFELERIEEKAVFQHLSIPKIHQAVYFYAQVNGWSSGYFPAGSMQVFLDNKLQGQSYFKGAAQDDTVKLPLGEDPMVQVKREKVAQKSRNAFMGKSRRNFEYRLEVHNQKEEPIQLILMDQLPISLQAEIEVEILETSSAKQDSRKGFLTWEKQLAAKEKINISLAFEIRHPRDKTITGL